MWKIKYVASLGCFPWSAGKIFLIHFIPALQGRLNLLKYSPRELSAPIWLNQSCNRDAGSLKTLISIAPQSESFCEVRGPISRRGTRRQWRLCQSTTDVRSLQGNRPLMWDTGMNFRILKMCFVQQLNSDLKSPTQLTRTLLLWL